MSRFRVSHLTRYDYSAPVTLGEHRMMLRPRDSHEIRLLHSALTVSPTPQLRWVYDAFGNSVALATFEGTTDHLQVESTLEVEHFGLDAPAAPLEERARQLPVAYDDDERVDLGPLLARQFTESRAVDAWTRAIAQSVADGDTMAVLRAMMTTIKSTLRYEVRESEGVQTPEETMRLGSGSCRDFALLMMEAARGLGLAARFASGYLYVPSLDGGNGQATGFGATHAWLQVFLPGAGWVAFDPTNDQVEGQGRIPIAIARTPAQTAPLSGVFTAALQGAPAMTVQVAVVALDGPPPAPSEAPQAAQQTPQSPPQQTPQQATFEAIPTGT